MRRVSLSFLLLLPLVSMNLWSQAVGGTLSGRVTAAAGAAVPNAAVNITNTETNVSQRVLTGPDGSFSVAGLAPGSYSVEVETAGFKRTSQQNIELTASTPASVNITLEAGNTSESVEITGKAPNVQGDNGELQLGVPTRTARELPVIDRNHQQLVQLQTGVTPPTADLPMLIDPDRNRWFSTNGQSPLANTWYLEGVVNQEPFRGTAIRVQPVETVQNMNTVTGSYTADKGYAGGAWSNNVTRGGTNSWHGSLFQFHSNNEFRSRSFFNMGGNPKPRFTYNQFGGTVGGAIVRDKTFFFGSYEGTYNRGENTRLATVPTADMRAGNFSGVPGVTIYNPATGTDSGAGRAAFPGNMIPVSRITSLSSGIQTFIPMPNLPGFTNNYIANTRYQNDWNKFDGRIDQHFSDRTSAFLRYGYSNLHTVDDSIFGTTIGSGDRNRLLAHNAVASAAHSFNPNLLTEFRFGYNRYYQKLRPGLDASALGSGLNDPGFGNSLFNIQVSGMQPFGLPANLPMNGVDNTFNWVWNWSWHTDRHNVRVGTDIRRFRSDGFSNLAFGPMGGVTFGPGATLSPAAAGLSPLSTFANSYASFLLGVPTATGASQYTESPSYRQSNYSLYLNDNLQIFRRLSLDLGVRWDVFSPLEPRRAGGAMFYDPMFNTLNFAGVNGTGMHVSRYDLNNVSPRIGFAFRATDKTVVRGGYGMQYFQVPYAYSGFMPALTAVSAGTPDTFATATGGFPAGGTISAPGLNGQVPANGMAAPNIPLNVVPLNTRTPYIQSFHFQVQQELVSNLVLNLGYVGTLGRQLPFVQELNAGAAGAGITGLPFASFGRTASTLLYDNGMTNNYNALQINLTKRFAHGLSFQGAYTWSKALGYTFGLENRLINPNDRYSNYGPLDYDRQHLLTLSHVWELPFGAGTNRWNQGVVGHLIGNWQVNGVFTWATGTPLTVTANPLFCNCPNNLVLAGASGPVDVTGNFGIGAPFFNTAAFSAPPANSLGSGGRGLVRGPGFKNYDMSVFRSFPIMERYKLEFRGEVYNISNTPRFMNPVTNFNAADFGQVTGTLNGAFGRQFNLAARILF